MAFLFVLVVHSQTRFCAELTSPTLFCVTGELDPTDSSYVRISIQSSALGWVGFGIGTSMVEADVYVSQFNLFSY